MLQQKLFTHMLELKEHKLADGFILSAVDSVTALDRSYDKWLF